MKTTKKKCPKKKPLALMFWYGVEGHELALCFEKSKKKLIQAKAKAQNLPKSNEQALDFLLTLPDEAMAIVRKWFRDNVKFELERQPETALEILKSLPVSKIDSEEFKEEWRALLSLFSEDKVPQNLDDFLEGKEIKKNKLVAPAQSENISKPADIAKGKEKEIEKEKEVDGFFVSRDMVQEYLKNLTAGEEASAGNVLGSLLDGAIAANKGDHVACEKAKASVAQLAGVVGGDLQALISQFESKAVPTGLRLRNSVSKKNIQNLDPELYCAVAEIKRILSTGQIFANVIGMMVDQNFVELSHSEARSVYPLGGEILAYPNTISGQHQEGELAVWRTEHRNTDKPNKLIITALQARLYEVISVPHPSTDPDGLREWLIRNYQHSSQNVPIFELSDRMLVRLPGDLKDPKIFKFENPLDLYQNLEAFELSNGRKLVISPLPAAPLKLDCAPPLTIIKRLLKIQKAGEQFPSFSRAQVDALSDLIKAEGDYPFRPSIARATERLGAISDLKEQLDEVVAEMLSLPKVTQRLEEEKKSVVKKFTDEQTDHQRAIQKLKDEKIKIEGEIATAKKTLKNQENELALHIKERFIKAQQDGMDTLAQVALFKGLLSGGHATDRSLVIQEPQSEEWLAGIEMGPQLASIYDMKRAVDRLAYATGLSQQLMLTVISAACSCGVVGLMGQKRDTIAKMLSVVLSSGVRCSVSVSTDMFSISDLLRSPALIKAGGHAVGMPLGNFLRAQSLLGRGSVVELLGANRVPPESYLPELIDLLKPSYSPTSVAWSDIGGSIATATFSAPVVVILGFVSGKSTFPFIEPLSSQVPIVPVDILWDDESQADESLIVKPSNLSSQTWSQLGSLKGEGSELLLSNLDAGSRLVKTLQLCGFSDSEIFSEFLLKAGRSGNILNPNESETNFPKLIRRLFEVMRSSGSSLFSHLQN